jgi:hypothetical protein
MTDHEAKATFLICDDDEQNGYASTYRAFGGRWTYDPLHAEGFDRAGAEDFNQRYYYGRYRVVSLFNALKEEN